MGLDRLAPHTREKLNTLEPTFLRDLPVCLFYLSVVCKPVQIFPCIGCCRDTTTCFCAVPFEKDLTDDSFLCSCRGVAGCWRGRDYHVDVTAAMRGPSLCSRPSASRFRHTGCNQFASSSSPAHLQYTTDTTRTRHREGSFM
jgi:hypothetical protein